jgi:8-oxo-dGTP diphosphatase
VDGKLHGPQDLIVKLSDIDWTRWKPRDTATLLFVVRGSEVLLMRKKRGLGAGKINAPGGRLEVGETPLQAAVREVQEELCVTPHTPRERGELSFHFVDGYTLHCHVFMADGCDGVAIETDEATPRWTPLDAIPYDEMWRDDAVWLPHMLAGRRFRGRFIFDCDTMLDHELSVEA